eukprot:6490520-Amphidinium_carterae.2
MGYKNTHHGVQTPIYLLVSKTSINNILTNSHARANAHSSIRIRRAEDISIEFNPVFNGQDPMSLNFQELLGSWKANRRLDNRRLAQDRQQCVYNPVVGPFNIRVVCHRDPMASDSQ